LLEPQGGDVTLDNVSITRLSRVNLARSMAYVPQAHTAYFPFTVLDSVLMGRTAHMGLFSTPSRRDREVARAALQTLGIAELQDDRYTSISGGQRQLVLIARALAQESKILIMDEPTASLDFGNQILVLRHIRRLAREGKGIILSTHDPDQALAHADRVAMLHGGRLASYGVPNETVTGENLRLIYHVEVDVVPLPDSNRRVCVPTCF
jgi:iron complex transport system ATP-binding protein